MVLISWTNHNFFLAASLLAAGPYPTNGPFHFGQAQKTFKIIIAYFHKENPNIIAFLKIPARAPAFVMKTDWQIRMEKLGGRLSKM